MADRSHRLGSGARSPALASVLWALIPVMTLGLGTLPMTIHAAVRTRSRLQALATLPDVAATALFFTIDPDSSVASDAVYGAGMFVNVIGGIGHAFAIRQRMWGRGDRKTYPRPLQDRQRAVLAAHRDECAAREAARAIAESDPQQALVLRIGRADLDDREFPDGGLVDVNHVPAQVLARILQLLDSEAEEVVRTRTTAGGFSSVADLSVTMDLPPRYLDAVADRLIFLPVRG